MKATPQDTTQDADIEQQDANRKRILAIVPVGGSKQYLGHGLQFSDIDEMTL